MEQTDSNIEDQSLTQVPVRPSHYIPPDVSNEDLEVRYLEHLEKYPMKTSIAVNEKGNTTTVTSHSLGEDGGWVAQEVVLDHPPAPKEEKKDIPADDRFDDDLEKLLNAMDSTEGEAEPQNPTPQDSSKGKLSKSHKKRITSLSHERAVILRKCQEVIAEEKDLALYLAELDSGSKYPEYHRREILVELKTFGIGCQSTKWEKKKAALEENMAFAATPEGQIIEEQKRKEEKEKEREKNKRKRAEKRQVQGRLGKHDVYSGEDSEETGRKRFRGIDSWRGNRHEGRGRGGGSRARDGVRGGMRGGPRAGMRGGRGDGRGDGRGRGRGRGGGPRPDNNDGSERPVVVANN